MTVELSKNLLLAVVLAPLFGSAIAGLFGRQVGRAGAVLWQHRIKALAYQQLTLRTGKGKTP